MKIFVASDIHGAHDQLRSRLSQLGNPTFISPWPSDEHAFETEHDAVTEFHRENGLASFEQKIAKAVNGEDALLIGFSVGATSIWRYVASNECSPNSRAVLYYGSRIRDCSELVPRCSTSVFFAEHEPSFDPHAVATLIRKSGAFCTVIPDTYHGFMSPTSRHYRPDIAQEQLSLLRSIAHPIRPT